MTQFCRLSSIVTTSSGTQCSQTVTPSSKTGTGIPGCGVSQTTPITRNFRYRKKVRIGPQQLFCFVQSPVPNSTPCAAEAGRKDQC
ncbi:hypothetical protein DPMN_072562 [Dreissena polymorpha]|uniref:Uncharacterized protein n=1 Tax=Dreissena polymorpha TaxID=45954 RepID=A0A9D4BWK4_DREPO|nr:hypothetical protein DPMN_072562 [Dreissena polymorpha]